MATDAMFKLEHGSDDKEKGADKKANLAKLEESRISMVDDYILNRMARDKFRVSVVESYLILRVMTTVKRKYLKLKY